MRSEIKRWGNSAAVRLPSKILAASRLEVSSAISMVVKGNKIIIEAVKEPPLKAFEAAFQRSFADR